MYLQKVCELTEKSRHLQQTQTKKALESNRFPGPFSAYVLLLQPCGLLTGLRSVGRNIKPTPDQWISIFLVSSFLAIAVLFGTFSVRTPFSYFALISSGFTSLPTSKDRS